MEAVVEVGYRANAKSFAGAEVPSFPRTWRIMDQYYAAHGPHGSSVKVEGDVVVFLD